MHCETGWTRNHNNGSIQLEEHTIMPLRRVLFRFSCLIVGLALACPASFAQTERHSGGEINLVVPDLSHATFFSSINGRTLLSAGLVVTALGLLFALVIYNRLQKMEVHP